jgi:hypothetical protein
MNTRGTQRYSFRTAVNNITPNQFTVGAKARFDVSQTISFGSSVPLSGDIILKGAQTDYTGSLGWIYANSYVSYRLNAPAGEESSIDITGVQFYPNLNVIKLIFQVGKVNFSSANPGASLNIIKSSQIKITGAIGSALSTLNGVHTVYDNPTEGYGYSPSNGFVYVLTTRASEAVLNGSAPYIFSVLPAAQPTLEISRGESQWKEVGVIGAEALRTFTETYGDYRLGINTLARANSTDYLTSYNVANRTQPRANLDVVGNAFISGKIRTNFADLLGGTPTNTRHAFVVGGDSNNPDSTASLRIATTTLSESGRTVGATADATGARLGINVNDAALDKNLVVSGDARITGDFTFQSDIDVNGGDIRSTSQSFVVANQATTTSLSLSGFATNVSIANLATTNQTLNIGNAATSQTTLNIHTNSTNSVVNIGTISNNIANTSIINVGGAFANRSSSIFRVKNYQTVVDGILTINGGSLNTTSNNPVFELFPSGLTTLSIGASVGNLTLGGVAGFSTIRNGLKVLGSSAFESDVTQNGGLKNTNIGIERNILGTIKISSLSRNNNIATLVTATPHNLATYPNNPIKIISSIDSFNTVGTVSFTIVNNTTITYSNAGDNLAITPATGNVLNYVGNLLPAGDLSNLNIDYFSVISNFDGVVNIQTVDDNKIIVQDSHWFSQNDAVKFVDVGNLVGVNTTTTYYILDRDALGFTLQDSSNNQIIISISSTFGDAGNARIQLFSTVIDTQGDIPWGSDSFKTRIVDGIQYWSLPISNPTGIGIGEFYLISNEIIRTVAFPTQFIPNNPIPYTIEVSRGERGTSLVSHPDGTRLFRLVEQENASAVSPNPANPEDTVLQIAEFSANLRVNDILRIGKINRDSGGEYIRVSIVNPANAQTFTITDGDFGNEAIPKNPLQVFKVISTTGDTQISGDVVIGYDTNQSTTLNPQNDLNLRDKYGFPSSTSTGADLTSSGGGNLKVHNSIELSGNTTTSGVGKQYFVITNGSLPRFYVESATGNTSIYNSGNFKIFKDNFFNTGFFDKSRSDSATNLAFEVIGSSGNTKIAGTLRAGDDFNVGTLLNSTITESLSNSFTSRFSVDAQTGDTYIGRYLSVNGLSSASPSAAIETLRIAGLGVSGNKPFSIKQNASIEAFGHENFYNSNGGRKTVFVTTQGNTDGSAVNLQSNIQYLVRPSSTLFLRLPSNAITGDVVRIVDVGGALNFAVTLIIRVVSGSGVRIQGSTQGSNNFNGGELVVNTPNAAFGLIYVGDSDSQGNAIASEQQGWFLMEI